MKPGYQRANLDEETADWRAVCGRTACTVRREGRGIPSLPLSRIQRPMGLRRSCTRLSAAKAATKPCYRPWHATPHKFSRNRNRPPIKPKHSRGCVRFRGRIAYRGDLRRYIRYLDAECGSASARTVRRSADNILTYRKNKASGFRSGASGKTAAGRAARKKRLFCPAGAFCFG
uniref:Uncharacterized protein n=1 Tax=Candidatus Kentrum sp. DK TaxID=2126562 RepID=A0A450TJW9_9GAMM|nr:MAG: hypothetical protein BECKDK2373C_GA0170839_11705 [Candidatus Kentron sp. DK]